MHENEEAALKSFLKMKDPGYALLIDAPWGAGKTHFVRTVCKAEFEPKHFRYASLNGVSNEAAFRRALLKDSLVSSVAKKGAAVLNTISKHLKVGDLGSIAGDIVEENLISNLPDTLIFDDLERSSINPQVLLGLLNDFVEHKGKRVILLAHSDAHEKKKSFLKRKEKLVGRTLKISANFDAAFPCFVSSIDAGQGKTYFLKHQKTVKEVFEMAGHQNLRLLRNVMRDCALVLDRLDKDLFEAKEPMSRFVRTYLALGMAYAKGDISDEDMKQRGDWKAAVSEYSKEGLGSLHKLYNKHKGADVIALDGAVLTVPIGELLFVKGWADDHALNSSLRLTGQFEKKEENPLWKRAVVWPFLGWSDLETLVSEANTYLFETPSVEAGPYLHVADSFLRIENEGGLDVPREKLIERILNRIQFLGKSNGVPPAKLGTNLGWSKRGAQFSFGGYACDATDEFLKIMNAMETVQVEAFHHHIDEFAAKLLRSYQTDLEGFQNEISPQNSEFNVYRLPIFHELDCEEFTTATLQHLESGKSRELGQIFDQIAERHLQNGDWENEKVWFCELRDNLEEKTLSHSKLARAQFNNFCAFHLNFK